MSAATRAWAIESFGGPEVFREVELLAIAPGPGEIAVAVHASSVNPVDYKLRRGDAPSLVGELPAVLHPDAAGVVTALGAGVDRFAVGDAVYAFANGMVGKRGALADELVADARLVARKPASLDFAEAAALPLVAVTAWFCLVDRAPVGPGTTLLVQGGTGGVGHVAVQLAAARGARVYATAGGADKCREAEALGAVRAFDYRESSPADIVAEATDGRGFDVVFNTPGTPSIDHSVKVAAMGGVILDILGEFPTRPGFQMKWLDFRSVFAGRPIVSGTRQERVGEILGEIAALVDAGRLRPLIDPERFTFDSAGAAHERAEHGHPLGKVVLTHPDR